MIQLTSINGKSFLLNSSLIYRIDRSPDSIITLRDGQKVMVQETAEEIAQLYLDYQKRLVGRIF